MNANPSDGRSAEAPPRPRLSIVVVAALILTAAIAHAALVFLYNAPSNAIRTAASDALEVYRGPQLDQGWVLFAPDISKANLHVLAGRHATRRAQRR